MLREKFKEALTAVLPMTLIVIILGLTITPLETHNMFKFILGAVFIILGLTVFLFESILE